MDTLEELARRAVSGAADTWEQFQLEVIRRVEAMARKHEGLRKRKLHLLEDDLAELRTATLERLKRNDFAGMRRFFEAADRPQDEPKQSFESWLYGAIDFTIRDHLRKRYGRAPRTLNPEGTGTLRPPSKRDVNTYAGPLGTTDDMVSPVAAPPMTRQLLASEILRYAETAFSPAEIAALRMHYVCDSDFADIAIALKLDDAKSAEKLIRRLNARLRYRFGDELDAPGTQPRSSENGEK